MNENKRERVEFWTLAIISFICFVILTMIVCVIYFVDVPDSPTHNLGSFLNNSNDNVYVNCSELDQLDICDWIIIYCIDEKHNCLVRNDSSDVCYSQQYWCFQMFNKCVEKLEE